MLLPVWALTADASHLPATSAPAPYPATASHDGLWPDGSPSRRERPAARSAHRARAPAACVRPTPSSARARSGRSRGSVRRAARSRGPAPHANCCCFRCQAPPVPRPLSGRRASCRSSEATEEQRLQVWTALNTRVLRAAASEARRPARAPRGSRLKSRAVS